MFQLLSNPTKFLRKLFYRFFFRIFSSFKNREKLARFMADNLETLLIAFLLAMFIRSYIIATFYIPSESMEDTLLVGDRLIGTRFDFLFRHPKKGEIVIFVYPVNPKIRLIKRMIGYPGDLIMVRDGILYINGQRQDEPYIKEKMSGWGKNFGPVRVPEDHYFVIGDNRNNSNDSRFWNLKGTMPFAGFWKDPDNVGFLPAENIESRPILRFWPINRFGVVQ